MLPPNKLGGSKVHYGKCYKGSTVLIECCGCFEDNVIFFQVSKFLKEVLLTWVLKDILDLMGRKGDMGKSISGGEKRPAKAKVWGPENSWHV